MVPTDFSKTISPFHTSPYIAAPPQSYTSINFIFTMGISATTNTQSPQNPRAGWDDNNAWLNLRSLCLHLLVFVQTMYKNNERTV
jgi:hypothetical protein